MAILDSHPGFKSQSDFVVAVVVVVVIVIDPSIQLLVMGGGVEGEKVAGRAIDRDSRLRRR